MSKFRRHHRSQPPQMTQTSHEYLPFIPDGSMAARKMEQDRSAAACSRTQFRVARSGTAIWPRLPGSLLFRHCGRLVDAVPCLGLSLPRMLLTDSLSKTLCQRLRDCAATPSAWIESFFLPCGTKLGQKNAAELRDCFILAVHGIFSFCPVLGWNKSIDIRPVTRERSTSA
jgi:hypothetical protein